MCVILLDSLRKPPIYREEITRSMARVLVETGAAGDARDAMRALHQHGYALFDVAACLDDARQIAFQQSVDLVAREMSAP